MLSELLEGIRSYICVEEKLYRQKMFFMGISNPHSKEKNAIKGGRKGPKLTYSMLYELRKQCQCEFRQEYVTRLVTRYFTNIRYSEFLKKKKKDVYLVTSCVYKLNQMGKVNYNIFRKKYGRRFLMFLQRYYYQKTSFNVLSYAFGGGV